MEIYLAIAFLWFVYLLVFVKPKYGDKFPVLLCFFHSAIWPISIPSAIISSLLIKDKKAAIAKIDAWFARMEKKISDWAEK